MVTNGLLLRVASSYLIKQFLAVLACDLFLIASGCSLGLTAVLLPQLKQDDTFPYDEQYDSWVASSACLAMVSGSIIGGILSDKCGRRFTQLLATPIFVVGWIIMAFANNMTLIILARVLTGMSYSAYRSIGVVYVGEISNPTNRPLFTFSMSVSTIMGTLLIHVLGGLLNWRLSCLIICLPIILGAGIQILVKESPLWLIYKGRIADGTEAFAWYRGVDEFSQLELTEALEKRKDRPPQLTFIEGSKVVFSKAFMKPLVTAILLFMTVQFCGVNTMSFYAQDLLKNIVSDQDPFMLMMVTDCARIVGVALLFAFSQYVPRRRSYVVTCVILVLLLVAIITYIAVEPTGLNWLAIIILMLYIGLGSIMVGLSWTFVGEIFPSNLRGLGSGMSSSFSFLILFVAVKITPEIMVNYGVIYVYTVYAVVTFIGIFFLYFLLPLTDGKTLQQIENSYSEKKVSELIV